MKTNQMYLWLLVVAFTLVGCSVDREDLVPIEKSATIAPEIIAMIGDMGFKTNDVRVSDDAYIVEGDVVIPKKYFEEPKTRQNYFGNSSLMSNNIVGNIKIVVDYKANGSSEHVAMGKYNAQLDAAIAQFNNVQNCAVKISKGTMSNFSILVQPDGSLFENSYVDRETMCAVPYVESYPRYISVNAFPDKFAGNWNSMSNAKVLSSLVHAIGHCLGLAHTDYHGALWSSDRSFQEFYLDPEWINGTPNSDYSKSVMNSSEHHYYNNKGYTLNDNDKLALSILYPATSLSGGSIEPGSQSIQPGDIPTRLTNSSLATGSGTPVYQWEKRTESDNFTWRNIPNAQSENYQPAALTEETHYRRKVTAGLQTEYSNIAYVYVKDDYSDYSGGTIAPQYQSIVEGQISAPLTNVKSATGGNNTPVYQWESASERTYNWSTIPGATSATYQLDSSTIVVGVRWRTVLLRRKAILGNQIVYSNEVKIHVSYPPRYSK